MKQGILLFLLTPRWPARYFLFLIFSLLPLFSKKGAKKRASVVVSRHALCSQVASDILRSHVPCRSPLVASTAGRRNSLRSNISPPVSLCCSAPRCATSGCPIFDITIATITCRFAKECIGLCLQRVQRAYSSVFTRLARKSTSSTFTLDLRKRKKIK